MKKEFIMPSMKVKVFDRTILLTDSTQTNTQAAENYAINNAGLTQSNDMARRRTTHSPFHPAENGKGRKSIGS